MKQPHLKDNHPEALRQIKYSILTSSHDAKVVLAHIIRICIDAGITKRLGDGLEEALPEQRNILTCVYCGTAYPDGTPPHGSQILTEHIRVCDKHPMRKLESDNAKLRKALIGLVGATDLKELETMEAAIRVLPLPDEDRMNSINAIHALRDTV